METMTKQNQKNSQFVLTFTREEIVNTKGSLNTLGQLVNENNINADAPEIIASIPKYLMEFTENQSLVFRAHYMRQMSIHEIRCAFGFKSINDVERPLKSSTEKFLKLLKKEFGEKTN